MRTAVVAALLGLGAFAAAAGLVLQLHAYPLLAKLQHDINTVSISEGEGVTAVVHPPAGMPEVRHNLRLTATTHVEGDLAAPEVKENGDVTVWKRATIVKEDSDKLVLSAEVRKVCLDRRTGEAVAPCKGEFYETEQGRRITAEGRRLLQPGLNFVFPFNTEQRDHRWYDTVLNRPVAIHFAGEQLLQGLDVYRFAHTVPPTALDRLEVPGALVGSPEPSVDVTRYYGVTRTLLVEPTTGAVLSVREDIRQELRTDAQAEGAGTPVFAGELRLTNASVTSNVDQVKQNLPRLFVITVLPVVLWVAGAVLVVAGLVLLAVRRRGLVAGALALVIGACLGGALTYGVTDANDPDGSLDLKNVVSSSNVDYGLR
ncbi:DUF3068 domain-containing protein [Lentzea cavernae]|uniref:DUF3068 domain-containing protein n=1 Tax=Lentzea cavernae TaxID=2020703 RepID=A0ABQ3MFM6_9PSEU|nr:DUF3068 domain-containing protein [Lentzea cavernae]GHH40025.1 hypothetical protein GCM10017774_32730 [Lentzea cavernae]